MDTQPRLWTEELLEEIDAVTDEQIELERDNSSEVEHGETILGQLPRRLQQVYVVRQRYFRKKAEMQFRLVVARPTDREDVVKDIAVSEIKYRFVNKLFWLEVDNCFDSWTATHNGIRRDFTIVKFGEELSVDNLTDRGKASRSSTSTPDFLTFLKDTLERGLEE
jgi:hypothetical protein